MNRDLYYSLFHPREKKKKLTTSSFSKEQILLFTFHSKQCNKITLTKVKSIYKHLPNFFVIFLGIIYFSQVLNFCIYLKFLRYRFFSYSKMYISFLVKMC